MKPGEALDLHGRVAVGRRSGLDAVFAPHGVAVIGASEREGSVGCALMHNLTEAAFRGRVYPVNPEHELVLGIKAYASISDVPDPLDLAVIATPAASIPEIVGACADRGVRAAIIISAGFRETGAAGLELEHRVRDAAHRGGVRVLGPNCLGVMNPFAGLNATFAGEMAQAGSVGFLSQSGALCTAILDWSKGARIGFSAFVSVGSMLDIGWGDLITYLADDPHTHSIVIYMESVGDAASFLSAARSVAPEKPIIVIKAGRTAQAAQAAASHTGALIGSDGVLDAAFRQCGVLRVDSVADLFAMADVLAKQPRSAGRRLAVVTNAGGPGILAADALIAGGGELAPLAPQTLQALDETLPPHWSHQNPVDVLGDADPQRYAKAVEIVASDPNIDGLFAIFAPQAISDAARIAERLRPYAHLRGKPVLASWMGGTGIEEGAKILELAGIPVFRYSDTAARMFNYLWRYDDNLRALYETPSLSMPERGIDRPGAAAVIEQAQSAGRTMLSELESKQVLAAYGIPVIATECATGADQAVALAERFGYPVAVKLHSRSITHKTDVGGVRLNVQNAEGVRRAYAAIEVSVRERCDAAAFEGVTVQPMVDLRDGYELIVGSSIDGQFGPVILFGSGGTLVEVYRDQALALPPLTTTLARQLMARTRIFSALRGTRGRASVDLSELERIVARFSQLVSEQRRIKEIEMNPLFASSSRSVALDARVLLYAGDVLESQLPRLAIRPYPSEYAGSWTTENGERVVIRPIRAEDEPLFERFHRALSEESVYLRYGHVIALRERIAHERLSRRCSIDYAREMALVIEYREQGDVPAIIGIGRLAPEIDGQGFEFSLTIADRFQHHGLGTELLRRLLEVARREGWFPVVGYILRQNTAMQRACRDLGFTVQDSSELGMAVARIEA